MLWNVRASGEKGATARVLRSIKKWVKNVSGAIARDKMQRK
jgi:hypothetical protein